MDPEGVSPNDAQSAPVDADALELRGEWLTNIREGDALVALLQSSYPAVRHLLRFSFSGRIARGVHDARLDRFDPFCSGWCAGLLARPSLLLVPHHAAPGSDELGLALARAALEPAPLAFRGCPLAQRKPTPALAESCGDSQRDQRCVGAGSRTE